MQEPKEKLVSEVLGVEEDQPEVNLVEDQDFKKSENLDKADDKKVENDKSSEKKFESKKTAGKTKGTRSLKKEI